MPEPADLAALHARELPQKDQLCGAFWGALALAAAGHPADGDEVALRAGTTLAEGDPSGWLPPGASPRTDYRLSIPVAADEPSSGTSDPARQFNLEFRAADAAACPHLALAVLVLAGLRGIREELPEPSLVGGDPAGLDEEGRRRLGVRPLPASLEEALEALEGDSMVRSWLSRDLFDCYVGMKRTEISLLEDADPAEVCKRYLRVY